MEKTQTYTENITPQTPAKLLSLLEYLDKLQETISYQLDTIKKQVKAKQQEQQEEQLPTISAKADGRATKAAAESASRDSSESAACSSYRQPSACTFNTGSLHRGSLLLLIVLKIC